MQSHQRTIMAVQWLVVAVYFILLLAPLALPATEQSAHITNDLSHFAQFLLWGICWPLIMLSMMFFGRIWCGVFCPDGTLTEFISRHGRKNSIPRWIRWPGWPLTMLVLTTIYGQLIGVYEFHLATLLLLGLPTMGALWVGFSYSNGKRVWCMYLCPANSVFAMLAKISPLHFRVDEEKWRRHPTPLPKIDCPPLIDIRRMTSTSDCHACGRCSGYLGAVELAVRSPETEILTTKNAGTLEANSLIFGVIGICTAAMQWSGGDLFVWVKSLLVNFGFGALNQYALPWWLLANHPDINRIFTLLDGLSILSCVMGGGALLGGVILGAVWLAAKLATIPELSWQKLSLTLIPIAGAGIFLGLSSLTLALLQAEGFALAWARYFQMVILAVGSLFSLWLGVRLIIRGISVRHFLALILLVVPSALLCASWVNKLVNSKT